jgi:uncharacterized protein YqeY
MLKDVILEKWKEAFKAKDPVLKSAYECVKAKILVEEKSGKYTLPLTDDIVVGIITKEVKELKETQNFYKPEDQMHMDINRKIEALSEYLPKQMTSEEVKDMIRSYIAATELDNVGRITGAIVKEVGSRFDKSKISNLVKEVLSE